PQTDLRIRSAFGLEGDEALRRLGYDQGAATPHRATESTPPPLRSSANDAADDVMSAAEGENGLEPAPQTPPDRLGG
ncbi:hypothetical protein, partial [Sphingorhabdus sp.]|uniref:hypothetical protein n=1 Tax=Sphingorhabdus sp. TaxID=1902408 RepID=UPI00391D06A6